MSFITDYEKVESKQQETHEKQKMVNLDDPNVAKNVQSITLQDMKDYFNSMKEAITEDFRKEIEAHFNKDKETDEQNTQQKDKEENE